LEGFHGRKKRKAQSREMKTGKWGENLLNRSPQVFQKIERFSQEFPERHELEAIHKRGGTRSGVEESELGNRMIGALMEGLKKKTEPSKTRKSLPCLP